MREPSWSLVPTAKCGLSSVAPCHHRHFSGPPPPRRVGLYVDGDCASATPEYASIWLARGAVRPSPIIFWMKPRRDRRPDFTLPIRRRNCFSFIGIPPPRKWPTTAACYITWVNRRRVAMPHSKRRIPLPAMTPGTCRSIVYHRFGRAGARPKAYLQASIHANELPGAMALHHLMPMLVEADRRGRIRGEIIIVPTINPIGLSQLAGSTHLGRYDFLGRENFNRNWLDLSGAVAERVGAKLGRNPADNVVLIRKAALAALAAMEPATELQTLRVEAMKLSVDADIVLDLHCDMQAVLHLFISRQDWPG